ncbi:kelch-like protein 32 isoform X2 [Rhinatrema bivittatum]|uniref:kelch-like protein 32 isoform X2 n=1 Tax=Rhinatrema bivittatum TaxID=194408 RepID=UPI0011270EB5|nr:kelch-like protein 32 isoform X2 [Rhinatrema bivittatum]
MPSEMCLSIQEMLTGQRPCQSKSHKDAVLAALNQQRNDGILCDVTLVAEEQKFHAHKAVLAACSDYFRAMFSLCMVESGADEVNLHGVTSLGLKQALDFAYTGQILLEPGVIQDVLAAGSHLQLLELLSLCSHYLIQELNSFNYLDLYKLADLFNLTLLETAVVEFLVKHLSELLKVHPEEVLALPYRLLREVLKSDQLTSLSEEQIWQGTCKNSFLFLLPPDIGCHGFLLRGSSFRRQVEAATSGSKILGMANAPPKTLLWQHVSKRRVQQTSCSLYRKITRRRIILTQGCSVSEWQVRQILQWSSGGRKLQLTASSRRSSISELPYSSRKPHHHMLLLWLAEQWWRRNRGLLTLEEAVATLSSTIPDTTSPRRRNQL